MQDGDQCHDKDGDGGGDGRTFNTQIKDKDENRIQNDIENGTARHDQHGFGGITGGSDQTGEVERHRDQKHSRQNVNHILPCVSHRFRRSSKEQQNAIQEKIAEQNHKTTKYEREYQAVAQNVLRPFLVFLAQNDGHAGCRTHSDK